MYLPNNYTFFIMVFRNISQSKRSDLHISSINFCLSINIAQIAASKVQTITHIFYHLPLKVMFHEKICKIDNCNLQNVSVRFLFFSCEVLTSYLAICKSIKSMEGWCTHFLYRILDSKKTSHFQFSVPGNFSIFPKWHFWTGAWTTKFFLTKSFLLKHHESAI